MESRGGKDVDEIKAFCKGLKKMSQPLSCQQANQNVSYIWTMLWHKEKSVGYTKTHCDWCLTDVQVSQSDRYLTDF